MATREDGIPIGWKDEKSLIEKDVNMAEVRDASGTAGEVSEKTIHVTFMAASEHWERNKNGKRLRSEIPESASALGDWRNRMERTIRLQARMMLQLHQTVDKIARLLEAHAMCEVTQWHGMRKWMEDRQTKWDARHKDDVLWGTGISDMAAKILARTRANKKEL